MTTAADPLKSASGTDTASLQVVLSLSADRSSGADVLFPERRITLYDGKESITIGRASKISTKGFVAGIDNAWFDSPVMSRLHARLFARMDQKKVEIRDLGSLHGTYVNDSDRLAADELRELKDGDTLRFGAPIWRGQDQFVPTKVKVGLQFPTRDGTSTFQVPDESDDEDSSESEDNIKSTINGRRPAVQNSSVQTTAADTQIIDLTGAQGGRQAPNVIDLSTPRSSPIRVHDETPASSLESHNDEVENIDIDQPNSPELGGPVLHDNSGDMIDVHRVGFPPSDVEHDGFDLEDEDEEHYGSDSLRWTDDDSQIDYPYEESEVSHLDSYSEASTDEEMDYTDDIDGIGSTDSLDDGMDLEDEDDITSDDGGAGVDSPNRHNSLYWDDDEFPPRLPILDYPEIVPLVDSLSSAPVPPNPSQIAPGVNTVASIDWLLNSDLPQPSIPAPPQKHVVPADSTSAKKAEALGMRTGKLDFFQAREQNKMALEAQKSVCPRPTSVQALCNEDEPVDGPSNYKFGPADLATEKEASRPPQVSQLVSAPLISPPFESVSSHVESQWSFSPCEPRAIGSPVSLGGDVDGCARRTHVGISDIVNTWQPSPSEGKLKRKADDISETTQEQEQWAAQAAKPFSPAPSVSEEEGQPESLEPHAAQELAELSDQGGEQPAIAAPRVLERPVKRARISRVAERLGYAALGGVTAGAMIVGTLIYTAPTFG
ncbi:hypothetical protein C8A01DRAFT_44309 [Parachaetomium inaequale]|uniref:FHA domain-containing protein n=1 Tax=Parachaetomium inaequale TaxID=2588326 RepID=A0AAN6PMN3_9PEZI|nr:hypothetical protein C8A01DRAFT_44309 [Parachaetomium inaequale]